MALSGSSKSASCGGGGGGEVINQAAAAAAGCGIIICVVDGCGAELGECRKYYQRHKVCELHSKTPQVSIHGQYLRFCQQCSRFHSLDEFDETKRSCRKRLDGHNRRRRKPRPDNNIFSPHQGTNTLQSAGPPMHPPTMGFMNPLWSGVVEAPTWVELDHTNYIAPSLLSSSVNSPSQSTLTHVVHPQSGSGSITTGGLLDQLQGVVPGGLEINDCDMGWGGMTDIDLHLCASLDYEDPQTHPFYWRYE